MDEHKVNPYRVPVATLRIPNGLLAYALLISLGLRYVPLRATTYMFVMLSLCKFEHTSWKIARIQSELEAFGDGRH